MGYIKEIKIGSGTANLIEPILYGTTNTAAGTQAKVVSISNFELITGVTIAVKFTVTNTHATPQLNVNSTGAKSIKYRGENLPSAATLTANRVYQFVYDGTNWELIGDLNTNTWRGIQDNLTSSTNTTDSLSAKQGYLLANGSARDNTKVSKSGDETVAGNKTFSGITTLSAASVYPSSQNTILTPNSGAIIQSPIPKYLWHDIIAFCRATTPTYYTTTDGSTWTESTLEKRLFAHMNAWGNQQVINSSISGSRWIWHGGGFGYSGITWIILGITYSATIATFDLLLETTSDATAASPTWTTICNVTNVKYNQQPIWIKSNTTSTNDFRLTITRSSGDSTTTVLPICAIEFLTTRWGDQGKGNEFEFPYQWNGTPDIYPLKNNTSTLGSSSLKWSNVYATTFTGNLTGNVTGNVTGDVSGTAANVTGTVAIGHGGTGATTASGARTNLGLGSIATYGAATAGTKDTWGLVPVIGGSDGVMEIGKYIDFHTTDGNTADYDVRITATTSGLTITGTTNGTFAGNLTGNVTGNVSGSAGSVALSGVTGANDLKAIEALTGTSGFLKKTAADTWALDITAYLPIKYSNLDYSSVTTTNGVYTVNNQALQSITGSSDTAVQYGGAIQFGATSPTANHYAAQLVVASASGGTSAPHAYIRRMTSTPSWGVWSTLLDNNNARTLLGVTDNSSNTDVTSSDTNLITARTLYYQLAKKGYTTNTGTVTSVAASGSDGITISGSPITTSGTIAIGLNLSTAINGLSEGTSSAQLNDYLIAQFAGGGTTTTTYHRRKVSAVVNATVVKAALSTNATHSNQFLRKDGTWQTPPYPVTSVAGNTGAITADTLRTSLGLSNAMHFIGITTTTMSDGLTTANVTINNATHTPSNGDVVLYSDTEYVWTGSAWERLGRDSSFKTTQTAITDSTGTSETTTATRFVYSVSQDANGVISVKTRPLPTYNNYSLPLAASGTRGGVQIGYTTDATNKNYAVQLSSEKMYVNVPWTDTAVTSAANHYTPSRDTSADKTASASGATAAWSIDVVKGITLQTDGKGHITGVSVTSGKIPSNPNTDTKLTVAEVTSGTTYYPIVGTGPTAATRQYDTTGFVYKGTNGTTSAVGSAQLTLGNSIASGTANNKQGQLIIYGSTAYAHTISGAPTAARTLTLPDKTGTIALTSDLSDTKVTHTLDTTTKYYITGTTSNAQNTGGDTFDTGIYATTTAGELSALKYSIHDTSATPVEKVRMEWNSTDQSLDFIFT